ncbi:UNKNOWN [Stylonychia lemnae]|uniref:GT44 domain-containing protein n=1 Tax=Stylonychia lemnae TaxID=5949 RepID=A0A078B5F0_STYLE|nr:UNKNOWN [Stylonychia lemnae]|eukprot:CDW89750.1 UNKNOWN [Stylonychia lemnae]
MLTSLNFLDFCIFPNTIYYGTEFITQRGVTKSLLRDEGDSSEKFIKHIRNTQQNLNFSRYEDDSFVYRKSDTARIPFITHRVWLSDPQKPKEMQDLLRHSILNAIFTSNKNIEQSNTTQNWTHYLWVYNKKQVPRTVRFFEQHRVQIREVYELDLFKDQEFAQQIEYYFENGRALVSASNIIRALVVYVYGGIYFDNDFYITTWDQNLHFFFDMVGFGLLNTPSFRGVNNAILVAKPGHLIFQKYLHRIITDYRRYKTEERPFHQNSCSFKTASGTLFGTGNGVFAIVIQNFINKNGNQDILITDEYRPIHRIQINTLDQDNKRGKLQIFIEGKDKTTNLWKNSFKDGRVFGWTEFSDF